MNKQVLDKAKKAFKSGNTKAIYALLEQNQNDSNLVEKLSWYLEGATMKTLNQMGE